MRLLVRPAEPFVRDVSVDLGSGQGGVAEHFLHAAQIRTTFEQMGGHRVPKAVRPEVWGTGHDPQGRMNEPAYHPWIDPSAPIPDEYRRSGLRGHELSSSRPKPCVQSVASGATDRHCPFLAALAEHSYGAPLP